MLRAAAVAGLPARLAAKRPLAVTVAARVALASTEARSPLLRALRCGRVPVRGRRVCICSAAGDDDSGSEAASSSAEGEEAASGEEGEGENASAIVPAVLRPEDCHTVRVLLQLDRH
jgi:Lon-like ATP-dependent protease